MNTIKRITIMSLFGSLILASACDDEPTVERSKVIQVYGSEEVYVGDTQEYSMSSYADSETFSWTVSGTGASVASGTGEYLNVAFNQPGTYSVKVTKPDGSEGTLDIEAISKTLALEGDTVTVTETGKIDTVGFPLLIDNVVAGTTTIVYTIDGTAVAGVDYEIVSPNPLVLTADSEEEAYFIYVRLLPDIEQESETKYIHATLTSVTTEIQSEVVLADEDDLPEQAFEIADDLRFVELEGAGDETTLEAPQIYSLAVTLSDKSTEDVTVAYDITGTGVNDVTATGTGTVTFAAGEITKTISLQFAPAAFAADQTVTVKVTSVTSADGEVVSNDDVKVFTIVGP